MDMISGVASLQFGKSEKPLRLPILQDARTPEFIISHVRKKRRIMMTVPLRFEADKISCFFPLLQRGFILKTRVGCSIKTLLCEDIGISPEYLENRIQTIFLDGKAVDDIESAIIRDGATLALSAAMPGLVGSTFRRGSHLAAFRNSITHEREETSWSHETEGMFTLKLFNLLVKELGPIFFERGIWIGKDDLDDFLKRQSEDVRAGFRDIGEEELINIRINFEKDIRQK